MLYTPVAVGPCWHTRISLFAVACEEALRATFRCTFPSNCNLQLFESGIFVHTAARCVGRESGRRFTHTEYLLRQCLPAEADADTELTQRQTTSRESQCKCSAPHIYWTGECPSKLSRRLTRTFSVRIRIQIKPVQIPCLYQFPSSHSFHHSVSINAQQTAKYNSRS